MCVVAGAVGAVASGVGSLVNATSGGGGGGGSAPPISSDIAGLLSGGLAAGLGISGLAGGNLSQLQAGAAAANPFGQYSSGFVPLLQGLLGQQPGSLLSQTNAILGSEVGNLQMMQPFTNIHTNTGQLSQMGNISTPGATGTLAGLTTNPQSVSLPSSISSILAQNPYQMNAGQQFQFQQGLGALNATEAAQGLIGSGKQLTDITNYGQQAANTAMTANINAALGAGGLANQMFGAQSGAALNLANLLSGQQQSSFANQLATQQLQSSQQQNTAQNLNNWFTQLVGINNQSLNEQNALLGPLLTATQASSSSPATAGGILAGLGVANQTSAGNLASGIGGITSGVGNLLSGINFGGNAATGSFSSGDFSGAFSSSPYYSGGGNSYGFTM